MRPRLPASTRLIITSLGASCALAAAPALAQSSARGDEARNAAAVARYATTRVGSVFDHGAPDAVRMTARDYASMAAPVLTPYRSTPSADVAPDGFSMRVPGTGLDLTNGSLSIRRSDARARGINFSVQLTY